MRCARFERWSLVFAISLSLFAAAVYAKDTPPATVKAEPRTDNGWKQRHESMNERVKKGNVDLL